MVLLLKSGDMSNIAYVRVSTELQNYGSQEYEIKAYCSKQGIIIDKWVSESVSGTVSFEKRNLGRLLNSMQKGDLLICTEISRLGRNMLMVMSILNVCSQKGIAIHSIKDNFDLSDNINSKIIAFAFSLAAEIERMLISQRTKEALAAKKLEGVRLGRPEGSSKQRVIYCNNILDIQEALDAGESITSVARRFGMHRNTLYKYLKGQDID